MASRPRSAIIEQMERALRIWIEDCLKKRIPLSTNIIKHKALQIYGYLKENGEAASNPDFVVSNGWFDRMTNRLSLQNLKIEGESASVDKEAAEIYPIGLKRIIKEGEYSTLQVVNADETGPKRKFISKDEKLAPGIQVSKRRVTLLICNNTSSEHMVKLVYKSSNPRALKTLNKGNLPICWAANKEACLTSELFKK